MTLTQTDSQSPI